MRNILILAGGVALVAGGAAAQLQPLPTVGSTKSTQPFGGTPHTTPPDLFKPVQPAQPFKPYQPPTMGSVYADGPLSPAGQAKRERKAAMATTDGPFSPAGEAKRARQEAKRTAGAPF